MKIGDKALYKGSPIVILHSDDNRSDVFVKDLSNGKKFTIIDFIYKFDYMTSNYEFINGNNLDLRRSNVKIYQKKFLNIGL